MTSTRTKPMILYFGTDWEGANRTSSHHVARWLGARYDVLFFECPGLRTPSVTSSDLGRLRRKLRSAFAKPQHPMPRVTVRTLLQLPLHRVRWARWLNRLLLQWQVRRAMRQVNRHVALVSWFMVPHVGSLAGTLGERDCVYYCVDDFSAFAGLDGPSARTMDERLTRRADLVFVSSATLLEDKRRLNHNVHHAPHGVDVAHFRRATTRPANPPADLPTGRPVIGYFGLIAEWIDLALVDRLAAAHPEWLFVMIGRIAIPETELPRRENLVFLGQKPYEQLPDYGAWFDVAIIPYLLTQQVMRANPIKLREYIAMEKPIVAVDTPDIRTMAGLVTIATGEAAWDAALVAAVASRNDPVRVAAQRHAADEMTWDRRMTAVESLLLSRHPVRR